MKNESESELEIAAESPSEPTEFLDNVATAGAILKAAREAKDMSVVAAATALHLRPKVIENIEADLFDEIGSTTYVRGYIRNYAKLIDADIEAIVSCLDQQLPDSPPPTMQSFSRKTSRQARDSRLKLVTYFIAITLAAMVVLWWVQKSEQLTNIDLSQPTVEEVAANSEFEINPVATGINGPVEQIAAISSASENEMPNSDEMPNASAELSELNDIANNEATVVQSSIDDNASNQSAIDDSALVATSLVAETQASTSDDASEQVQDNVTQSIISMELSGDCWVNVVDVNGKVIIDGVKSPGRVISASGVAPFNVILGAPQVVSMQLDGDDVDLSAFASGRVARLTLPTAN